MPEKSILKDKIIQSGVFAFSVNNILERNIQDYL